MPDNKKEEFKKEFIHQFMKTLSRKQENDNKTVLLDAYKVLVVFAQKIMS